MHVGENTYDEELGQKVHTHLEQLGFEHSFKFDGHSRTIVPKINFAEGLNTSLVSIGFNLEDPSLVKTPERWASMMVDELMYGMDYKNFPKCTTTPNGIKTKQPQRTYSKEYDGPRPVEYEVRGAYNQMVLVKDIQIMSLCEHHLQTIDGVAHIAYIPQDELLGLSKFARVANFFARRPQVQERLTAQIFHALQYILKTDDIAIVIQATHYCMRARGAQQAESTTTTDQLGGRFFSNPSLRGEFLDRVRAGS